MTAQPSHSELVRRYRRLVQAEPSDAALRSCMTLAQDVLGVRIGDRRIDGELKMLDEDEDLAARTSRHLSADILDFMHTHEATRATARKSRRIGLERRRLVTEAAYTLGLPGYVEARQIPLARDTAALLLDTSLLVFHQIYFGPWLALGDGERQLRALLREHSLALAERLPPADRARLRALVLEAAGQHEMADGFRDEAVELTDSHSHEYMTVLQAAWSGLIERKRFAQAMLLLDREAPRVPEEHVEEFEELVLETTRSRRAA